MRNCPKRPDAVARICGGKDAPQLSGCIEFYQEKGCVFLVARISGLPKESKTGFFGLHIHEGKCCSGAGFSGTGSHYDPSRHDHPKHAGDLPPLMACGEKAYLAVRTDRFCVEDIIGRTIIIHSDPDDFRSQPAGNAGKKIACGVIGKG